MVFRHMCAHSHIHGRDDVRLCEAASFGAAAAVFVMCRPTTCRSSIPSFNQRGKMQRQTSENERIDFHVVMMKFALLKPFKCTLTAASTTAL